LTLVIFDQVLLGLSGVELDILDEFEDVEYTRTDVDVFLAVSLVYFTFYSSINLLVVVNYCITNEANVMFPKNIP